MKIWDLKRNTLLAKEEAAPTLTSGVRLVMALAVKVLKETFLYGLRWNLQ